AAMRPHARPSRQVDGESLTRMYSRFSSTMRSPTPFTRFRSSGDANAPLRSRSSMIASASAGPTPFSSRASVSASAVFTLTGPASRTRGASSAAASTMADGEIRFMTLPLLDGTARIVEPAHHGRSQPFFGDRADSSFRAPRMQADGSGPFSASRDQRVELDALDRPHRLPLLAARAVPDQAPRAVSAVRAAVSRARQREAAERGRDPLHGARLLGRVRRPKLVDIDETREDL